MSQSLTSIEEKITNIETNTADFFREFQPSYRQYLKLLGHSIEQQLILATHHICTQVYPDAFLRLTFNQRQKLQDRIRQLGRQFQSDLFIFLKDHAQLLMEAEVVEENNIPEISDSDLSEGKTQVTFITITNPDDLLQWNRAVEQGIQEILEKISREANSLLRGAAILTNSLPAKVLEMALQAEESGMGIGRTGSPNITHILIEATSERKIDDDDNEDNEDDDDDDDAIPHHSSITKITAIHLRLAEIEFSDTNLSHARKQLRSFLEKLSKLRQQYRLLQREHLIVEAKNAWRSSWIDN